MWITVDVDLWKHPKIAALPNDTARYGWIVTLSEAKLQHPPGRFASRRHYLEVMGRFGKYLKAYTDCHLLDQLADGALIVHDWQKHQWATKKERQRGDIRGTLGGQRGDIEGTKSGPTYTETETDTKTESFNRSLRVRTSPTRVAEILPSLSLGRKEE